MTITMDPQQNEVRALRAAGDWRGQRVLEIGCGDGRLTRRLARLGATLEAIDPDVAAIRAARRQLPRRYAKTVRFHVGQAETLNYPDESFDRVVFAWSLCWIAHTGMVHALREARRVLKPGGVLIDLRPGLQHRRVSVVRGSQARPVGVMRESFDDVHAANQAVANVVSQRLLRFERRQRLDCDRVMDGAGDFRDWLADFVSRDDSLPAHDWLVERLERALARERGKAKVVVAGPLEMRVLTKTVRARPPRLKDPKNSG